MTHPMDRICSLLVAALFISRTFNHCSAVPSCPNGYASVNPLGDHWCFVHQLLRDGLNFEDAVKRCEKHNNSLALPWNININEMIKMHRPFWIGLHCANGAWEWQDGRTLDFHSFKDRTSKMPTTNCSGTKYKFAVGANGEWIAVDQATLFKNLVCTTRAKEAKEPSYEIDVDPEIANPSDFPLWAILLLTACVIIVLGIGLGFAITTRKSKMLHKKQAIEEERIRQNFRELTAGLAHQEEKSDPWEISRNNILIKGKIDEGAFGRVYKAHIHHSIIPLVSRSMLAMNNLENYDEMIVAVKMSNETTDKEDRLAFLKEINTMKGFGHHQRLVCLLACVSVSKPECIIMQFCSNGNLLAFLRERKAYMLQHAENPDIDQSKFITQEKMMQFAAQVASGMEFLCGLGYVHRDLAARNIMVDDQETCKIGDFGLCRKMGEQNEPYLSRGGLLPLFWAAPESIENGIFSQETDVWAYGVLLFEITTLGSKPYIGWKREDVLDRLKSGERMTIPENCAPEMYALMRLCWHSDQAERPNFTTIKSMIALELNEEFPDNNYEQPLNLKKAGV